MGQSESKKLKLDRAPPGRQDEAGLLHIAARQGHVDTARHILSQETAAVNRKDALGRTPLFWATEYRHQHLVELLLAYGADPSVQDHEGNLCLHWAAFVGNACIARMLLDSGSELNGLNDRGDLPLHLAARERHYECLVLFLSQGAKVSLKNKAGLTPLQYTKVGSPCWSALQAAASHPSSPSERLLCRDITRGFERVPIPCVNGVDDETWPSDFLYVTQNVVSNSVGAPGTARDRSQPCKCPGDCSATSCPCIRSTKKCGYTTDGRLVLQSGSVAEDAGPIYECSSLCPCASSCRNRVVQMGIRIQLQLYRLPGKGWGVRTVQDLPQGAFVCRYVGELISTEEAAQREEHGYCFALDGPWQQQDCCLDGRFYGNVGRFVNHSCQPNVAAVQVAAAGAQESPGIAFFSTRPIRAGEELGVDYGERFWAEPDRSTACLCDSPLCRYRPRPDEPAGPLAASPPAPPLQQPCRGFALKSKRSSPWRMVTRARHRHRHARDLALLTAGAKKLVPPAALPAAAMVGGGHA